MTAPFGLWVYLSTSPLLWLTVTFFAWLAADALARFYRPNPLANPVLIAVIIVDVVLPISTGIMGAVMVTPLRYALRIRNFAARGFRPALRPTASAPPTPSRWIRSQERFLASGWD